MKWIIVLTDFSEESRKALEIAHILLKNYGQHSQDRKILLLNILDTSSNVSFDLKGEHISGAFNNDFLENKYLEIQEEMKKMVDELEISDKDIFSTIVTEELALFLKPFVNEGIDLLLMGKRHRGVTGTKGASGHHDLFIEENLESIIKNVDSPFMLVDKKVDEVEIKNILINVPDSYQLNKGVIERAKLLQRLFKARLSLLKLVNIEDEKQIEIEKSTLKQWALKNELSPSSFEVRPTVKTENEALYEYAQEIKADVIVLKKNDDVGSPEILDGSSIEDQLFINNIILSSY